MTKETAGLVAELDLVNPCWEPLATKHRLAARIGDLTGKRAGFLDNRKDNADVLLKHIGAQLEARYGASTAMYATKVVYSRRAEPAVLDELAAKCDFVITATGA